MTINFKGDKPGRNTPCKCGSGLKFKHCHGDTGKIAVCERIVAEAMLKLVKREQHKRNLITDGQYQKFLDRSKTDQGIEEVTPKNVDDAMGQLKMKRCSGALCNTPIPDNQTHCMKCKTKLKGKL